jgi:CTP synthase (UTP-ammonia lyase)
MIDMKMSPDAVELPVDVHPFFIGTLFQPERAALRGETPPFVRALSRRLTRLPHDQLHH